MGHYDEPVDMVNSPSHYNQGGIECIDAIRAALGDEGFKAYCRGNAIKYTWRAGLKLDEVEDLKKAAWYNRMAAGDDPRKDYKPADSIYTWTTTSSGTMNTNPTTDHIVLSEEEVARLNKEKLNWVNNDVEEAKPPTTRKQSKKKKCRV